MTPDELIPDASAENETLTESPAESFGELLAEFEHTHTHKAEGDAKQMEGTVVSMDAEAV